MLLHFKSNERCDCENKTNRFARLFCSVKSVQPIYLKVCGSVLIMISLVVFAEILWLSRLF